MILPSAGGSQHYMIVKLDTAGNGIWYYYPTQPASNGLPGGNVVNVLTTKGGVTYVTTNENATIGNLAITDRSSYIFKLNAAGKVVKERFLNRTNNGSGATVSDIAFDKNGNVFTSGTSFGATATVGDSTVAFVYPYQQQKLFVAKFDDALNFDWCVIARSYETNSSITVADSVIYATGDIVGSAKFGNIEEDNYEYDFYLAKISPVALGKPFVLTDARQPLSKTPVSSKFEVYPNPVSNNSKIQFNLTKAHNVSIQIISNDGKVLSTSNKGILPAGNYTYPLNASLYKTGVYFVRLIADNIASQKEFIK